MISLLQLGLKMLASERSKFFTLVFGITLAIFLLIEGTAVFTGMMHRLASNIINIGGFIWVMDPSVNFQDEKILLPSSLLDKVRSIKGVKYAAPLIISFSMVKFDNGHYQNTEVIGLDDNTFLGKPVMIQGNIKSLYRNNAYIGIQNTEYDKLYNAPIGTSFKINGQNGVITGIGKNAVVGLWGLPTLYTSYHRAATFLPPYTPLTFILIEPDSDADIAEIKERVGKMGFLALTQKEFLQKNWDHYIYNTGLGVNLWIIEIICYIIGLVISGQVFYMFILDNLYLFGTLKAIGVKKKALIGIILFQSTITGIIGYGMGAFLSFIWIAFAKRQFPNYVSLVTYEGLLSAFFLVLVIISVTSIIGIRKITQIQPFDIFRG